MRTLHGVHRRSAIGGYNYWQHAIAQKDPTEKPSMNMYQKQTYMPAVLAVLLLSVDGFVLPNPVLVSRDVAPAARVHVGFAPLNFYKEQLDDVTPTNLTTTFPSWQQSLFGNKTPFPSWPQSLVESRGDYSDSDEAYVEELIGQAGGPLYAKNKNLPRLPIPTLQETIERFLPTALPLCESEEERRTLFKACNRFEEEAKPLQERLQKRREEWPDSSWLQKWWNQKMYLEYRDPVAVYVSYFLNEIGRAHV